jgi:short-subunit dehydrogenase
VTWVIVGASAGLGRSLAEHLARDGGSLMLVARDERDLAPLASDLTAQHGARVRFLAQDADDPPALADRLHQSLAGDEVEGLLFPVGMNAASDEGQLDPAQVDRLVNVNFVAITCVIGRFLPVLLRQRRGVVVGFGSIAAIRGRGRNVVYSAAKRALESYFESLRHLTEREGLTVVFYVLGYLDTNLAFGQKLLLPPAPPAVVAAKVCRRLYEARGKHYLPGYWAIVALLFRAMPWWLFKRLRF